MGDEKKLKEQRIAELRARAEMLLDEADGLRDEARSLEREAQLAEQDAEDIEADLANAGLLYLTEEAEMWGEAIARVIYKSADRIHFTIGGKSWVSTGHIAWATDRVSEDCRGLENGSLRSELQGRIVDIDTTRPVERGEGGGRGVVWSDFDTEAGRVRFQDPFTEAARVLGDRTGVTCGDRILVAFRDDLPVFLAMPMRGGSGG